MTPGANLSIVLATALAAAGLTADLSDGSTIYSSPLVDLPVETLTECGQCLQSGCDPDEHSLNVEADWKPDRTYGESSHGCRPDYCSQAHSGGGCSGFATLDPEERLRLWNAVVQLGDADLAALVRELGEPVSYNAERQALQVRGCDGNVALSIPLSAAQAQRLAE